MTQKTATRYRVVARYVTLRIAGSLWPGRGNGYTVSGFYAGAVLPADAHVDDLVRLLAGGMIEEVSDDV